MTTLSKYGNGHGNVEKWYEKLRLGSGNAKFEWGFQIEFWLLPACSPQKIFCITFYYPNP